MAPTRRTLLKTAGMAAVAGRFLGRAGEAEAQPKAGGGQSPRGQTWCNLKSGLGMKQGDRLLDVAAAAKQMKVAVPASTDDLIAGKEMAGLHKVLSSAKGPFVSEKDAQFAPCILRPEKIVCLGFNYRKHIAEVKVPTPTKPVLFNKYNNSLLGHGGTIKLPTKAATKFDYEVELQVIIGKTARDVSEAEALDSVFGYATGNDFSARDLQLRDGRQGSQFMIGKTPDGFFPVGPYIVGAEVVGDPQKLAIECKVNGEQRQSSNTSDMLFSVAQVIAYMSTIFTLKPGDIISTGTPEGVILGKPEPQQVWLKAGDKVSCSIEKLGELRFDLA
jgi:2-keto-4-pentenoate hydratase/2-oxohepta-3-ene-1,7-dioic acid hydratase in catechol pathway